MASTCAYKGCCRQRSTNRGLIFHRFPVKNSNLCRQWIDNCGRPGLHSLPLHMLHNLHVCSKHFEKGSYRFEGKKLLLPTASPVPMSSSGPSAPIKCNAETSETPSAMKPTRQISSQGQQELKPSASRMTETLNQRGEPLKIIDGYEFALAKGLVMWSCSHGSSCPAKIVTDASRNVLLHEFSHHNHQSPKTARTKKAASPVESSGSAIEVLTEKDLNLVDPVKNETQPEMRGCSTLLAADAIGPDLEEEAPSLARDNGNHSKSIEIKTYNRTNVRKRRKKTKDTESLIPNHFVESDVQYATECSESFSPEDDTIIPISESLVKVECNEFKNECNVNETDMLSIEMDNSEGTEEEQNITLPMDNSPISSSNMSNDTYDYEDSKKLLPPFISKNFLLSKDDEGQILCFGSADYLPLLCNVDTIFIDAMLRYDCPGAMQIFTITVCHEGNCLPLIFFTMFARNYGIYKRALENIIWECALRDFSFEPKEIIADFDINLHEAIRTVWSSSELRSSRYFLLQPWWNMLKQLGLKEQFELKSSPLGARLNKAFALAYMTLSPDEVGNVFRTELCDGSPLNGAAKCFFEFLLSDFMCENSKFPPSVWARKDVTEHRVSICFEQFHSLFRRKDISTTKRLFLAVSDSLQKVSDPVNRCMRLFPAKLKI